MFKIFEKDGTDRTLCCNNGNFITFLQNKWDRLHEKDLSVFRYKLNSLEDKVIGAYTLQLNEDRGQKRRTPEEIANVTQPFDYNKFNFNKASHKEILFNLVKEGNESDVHSFLVNVSPISRYHCLLCPSMQKCLPQVVTQESVQLALEVMFMAQDRDLRIGLNSLCGFASVNHLHYHLCWVANTLPIETVKCKQLNGILYCFEDYPVPGFCFEVPSVESIPSITVTFYNVIEYFLKNSIAHNVLISRGQSLNAGNIETVRLVVWPRKSNVGVKQLYSFNVATYELSGWFPITSKPDYDKLTIQDLDDGLRKWRYDDFSGLCDELKLLF